MTRIVLGFLGLLVLLPALQARDEPEKQTPEQQYRTLEKEYQTAEKEFRKALASAKGREEQQKVFQEKFPRPEKFATRFLELAEKNPKDPAAVDALVWIVSHIRAGKSDSESPRTKAVHLLLDDHVRNEKMAAACPSLGKTLDDESRQLLQAVLEKNKHRLAQGQACLALAQLTENRIRLARRFKDDARMAKGYENFMGKDFVEALTKAGPEKLGKEAEALYERVVKDFGNVADPDGGTLGENAKEQLDAMRHPITVGKPAPEINGEDIDGAKFRLSDYRGKVVLLDFWGNW